MNLFIKSANLLKTLHPDIQFIISHAPNLSDDVFDKYLENTDFKVIKRYARNTLIKCILDTGRTHQIRVHMAYIGHRIVNDPLYGKKFSDFGQFLHSASIDFDHPITKEHIHFECDLPKEFQDFLDKLD